MSRTVHRAMNQRRHLWAQVRPSSENALFFAVFLRAFVGTSLAYLWVVNARADRSAN